MEKVDNNSPLLRKTAKPVPRVDNKIRKILDDMVEFCRTHTRPQTLSVAANQVGVLKRLIVIFDNKEILKLANPVIKKSSGRALFLEACVNVDKENYSVGGFVERPAYIEVEALDYNNNRVFIKATGVLAVMLQHEMDHLDGIMYTDKLIGDLIKFSSPEERVEFRKEHPLKITEKPIYEDKDINKVIIL